MSIGDGAIALHSESGIPLRLLGTGSARLLIAGLQRAAAEAATIVLIDEVEYGLEPHRLVRLLDSLGAKDRSPPLQVFMTSHSPVALRELSGGQVFITRASAAGHSVQKAGTDDDVQSLLRRDPEAFLAKSVLVCEGASEVGLARGLDQFWAAQGDRSFSSLGGAYVDVGGGNPDRCLDRALSLLRLGYRVLVLLDADKPWNKQRAESLEQAGGHLLTWRDQRSLEDELFLSLADEGVGILLARACDAVGRDEVSQHIQSRSNGRRSLDDVEREGSLAGYSEATRRLLGQASRMRNNGWFKSVSKCEALGREVVGPSLDKADVGFVAIIERLRAWSRAS